MKKQVTMDKEYCNMEKIVNKVSFRDHQVREKP